MTPYFVPRRTRTVTGDLKLNNSAFRHNHISRLLAGISVLVPLGNPKHRSPIPFSLAATSCVAENDQRSHQLLQWFLSAVRAAESNHLDLTAK